jgi:hypothetical protein
MTKQDQYTACDVLNCCPYIVIVHSELASGISVRVRSARPHCVLRYYYGKISFICNERVCLRAARLHRIHKKSGAKVPSLISTKTLRKKEDVDHIHA